MTERSRGVVSRRLSAAITRRAGIGALLAAAFTLDGAAEAGKKRKRPAKVTLCVNGVTVKAPKKKARKLQKAGAARGACPPPRCSNGACIAFVTSSNFNGEQVGGLAGGDAKCQAAASSAGLPGSYRAWLSAGASTPVTRFTTGGDPYRLVADASSNGDPGPLVAANFAALTSCFAAGNCLLRGIDRDEHGVVQPGSDGAWTGTLANGSTASETCGDWSVAIGTGRLGTFGNTDARWTEEFTVFCGTAASLYCFEQAR